MFFILEETKQTILDFSPGTVKVLQKFCYSLIKYQYTLTKYKSLNVKLSNSQLNKSKLAIKSKTEVILRQSSIMTGNTDELLLNNQQVANLHKAFVNNIVNCK